MNWDLSPIMNTIENTLVEKSFQALMNGNDEEFIQCMDIDQRILGVIFRSGNTPLHLAVQNGSSSLVAKICEACSPSLRDQLGYSPLHDAAKFGHSKIAKLLIDYGADVNCLAGRQRESPLYFAAAKAWDDPFRETVSVLESAGATIDVHSAILMGRIRMALSFLKSESFNIHEVIARDRILHSVLSLSHDATNSLDDIVELLRLLVRSGAELNTPIDWRPVLLNATSWSRCPAAIIQELIDLGANPIFRCQDESILDVAIELGNSATIDIIRRAVADECRKHNA